MSLHRLSGSTMIEDSLAYGRQQPVRRYVTHSVTGHSVTGHDGTERPFWSGLRIRAGLLSAVPGEGTGFTSHRTGGATR